MVYFYGHFFIKFLNVTITLSQIWIILVFLENLCYTNEQIREILQKANPTDNLKKLFVPYCAPGPALLEHLFLSKGIVISKKKRDLDENIEPIIVEA